MDLLNVWHLKRLSKQLSVSFLYLSISTVYQLPAPVMGETGISRRCRGQSLYLSCVKMLTSKIQESEGPVKEHPGGLNPTTQLQVCSRTFITSASSLCVFPLTLHCQIRQNTIKDHLKIIYKRKKSVTWLYLL